MTYETIVHMTYVRIYTYICVYFTHLYKNKSKSMQPDLENVLNNFH